MIERLRRSDLPALRPAGQDLVTFGARLLLVLRMAEANAKGLRECRRPRIATQLMTGAARGDIATAGLRARRVTAITGGVRIEARRYRQRHPVAAGAVTGGAAHSPHVHVRGVIELHAEALQTRKRFQRS